MNPLVISVGGMPPPSMIYYQVDQSHPLSSRGLPMALGLPTPLFKSETSMLEECGKTLLKMMMAIIKCSPFDRDLLFFLDY